MKISIHKNCDLSRSIRVRQLECLFDIPAKEKLAFDLEADLPVESRPWNIGLIVGPSGSGKTLTLRALYPLPWPMTWMGGESTIDSVRASSVDDITEAFQAVGFNTIPSWMRPFGTLSNGEQFRATLARVMVEAREAAKANPEVVATMDEFTSVVDRQVAKIGSYAVNKYVRKHGVRIVVASCHYDIIDWLQPDWIFDPAEAKFHWRELQRGRPSIECEIRKVPYAAWWQFAPFHYLTPELNRAAQCFVLFVDGRPASFAGNLHRPHPHTNNIIGCSRAVTLPDWQGLGLVMVLLTKLGALYSGIGKRFRIYPNHPAFVRSVTRAPAEWKLVKEAGNFSPRRGASSTVRGFGGRSCAVFEYVGNPIPEEEGRRVLK